MKQTPLKANRSEGLPRPRPGLLAYGMLVWLACHLFVLAYEEPTLRKTFGAEYVDFCANVARWIPHLSPWRGTADGH